MVCPGRESEAPAASESDVGRTAADSSLRAVGTACGSRAQAGRPSGRGARSDRAPTCSARASQQTVRQPKTGSGLLVIEGLVGGSVGIQERYMSGEFRGWEFRCERQVTFRQEPHGRFRSLRSPRRSPWRWQHSAPAEPTPHTRRAHRPHLPRPPQHSLPKHPLRQHRQQACRSLPSNSTAPGR